MSTITNMTPRVWLACLAAYNDGCLHGAWVDATDADELHEAAAKVLATSPIPGAEEIAIHDYDEFGKLGHELGEYPSFEQVAAYGAMIEEYGVEFLAFCEADERSSSEFESLERDFDEARCGQFETEKDYAYEYVDSCGWGGLTSIPDELAGYIDWDAIAKDLFRDGPYTLINGYVFREDYH